MTGFVKFSGMFSMRGSSMNHATKVKAIIIFSARILFRARTMLVQIYDSLNIFQVRKDRKWVNMCAGKFTATD